MKVAGSPLRRSVRALAGDPLIRNGHALNLSTFLSSVLGFVFWILAARHYPAAVVGRNSVAISAMMFFGGVAQLNMASVLVRFLPPSGPQGRRLVIVTYAVAALVSTVLSGLFLALVPLVVPSLNFLVSSWSLALWFVMSTACWAIFALEDGALTGLRRTSWIPVENGAFATLKAVAVLPLARLLPGVGVFVAWSAATLATIVPTNRFLFRWALPAHGRTAATRPPVTARELYRFGSYDFVGSLFWLGATSLLPLLVISGVGAGRSAAFQLSWVISYTLYLMSINLGSSLVVETAHDQRTLRAEVRRVRLHLLKVLVPTVVVVLALAPYLLDLFGSGYSEQGTTTLRLLVLSAIPFSISATAVSASRSLKRTRFGCGINLALFAIVSLTTWLLIPGSGILGVGIGWCVAQFLVAAVLLAGEERWLFRHPGSGRPAPEKPGRHSSGLVMGVARLLGSRHFPGAGRLPRLKAWGSNRRARKLISEMLSQSGSLRECEADPLPLEVQLRPGGSDRAVALLRCPRSGPWSMIKVPRSSEAQHEMQVERRVLTEMAGDPRLDPMRDYFPRIEIRTLGGTPVVLEAPFEGTDALSVLVQDPAAAARIEALGLVVIRELHARTSARAPIDDEVFEELVGAPLQVLAAQHPTGRVPAFQEEALRQIEDELRRALGGRQSTLSWTHGDFTPGNVMVAQDLSRVCGILDWSQASRRGVGPLDDLLWQCSIRCATNGQEFGWFIRRLLADDAERRVLEGDYDGPVDRAGFHPGVLLLWCWLRHVAGNITKRPSYGRNPVWWVANVEPVLHQVLRTVWR